MKQSLTEYLEEIPSFVINLDRRPDRMERFRKDWPEGIQEPERFSAVDGQQLPGDVIDRFVEAWPKAGKESWDGEAAAVLGCRMSHLGVLNMALERGYERVMVFEDDARFDMDALRSLPAPPPSCEIALLGSRPQRRPTLRGWHRHQRGWIYLATAYVVGREALPHMIEWATSDPREIDVAWEPVLKARQTFYAWPRAVNQVAGFSDIQGRRRYPAGTFVKE